MRIGVYVQTWHVGGVATFCFRLAQGLHYLGHTPLLILGTPFGKRDAEGKRAYERLVSDRHFPIVCLHLNAFHPKERPWRAADKIAALGCEVLFLSAHRSLAEACARLRTETCMVGVAHTDDEETYAEFQACERYCEAYSAVSRAIFQRLSSLSKKSPPLPIEQIAYGVPTREGLRPAPESSQSRVLTVCRLEQEQKRVLDLPIIWKEYRQKGGRGTLTICGSGKESVRLRQAFDKEIERGLVDLRGAVPLELMSSVYAQHDVLLSVSAYEGLPIAVLEGAAEGLYPILSRTRSGHEEILDRLGEGRLCAIGDTGGFATALSEITSQLEHIRGLRPLLQERARKHFNLDNMVKAYAKLATEAITARSSPIHDSSNPLTLPKQKVDFLRRFIRRWQYSRHHGWRV
jgi:glycosyltransferase involved in cell wall biosynthesis